MKLMNAGIFLIMAIVHGAAMADTIALKGDDPSGQSSFVTNVTGLSTGWSNGAAPSPAYDYVVNVKDRILRTPGDSVSGTRHAFVGNSLEISNDARLMTVSYSPSSVDLGSNFKLTHGSVGTMSGWTGDGKNADIYGTVAIGSDKADGAKISTPLRGTWKYHTTIIGDADKKFRVHNNCTLANYEGSGDSYARKYYCGIKTVFDGDMSAFLGTMEICHMVQARLDSAERFGGTVSLLQLSKLTVEGSANGAQAIAGAIKATDGFVNVGANESLTVKCYDSQFADVSALRYRNKSYVDENVYTGEPFDENYVQTHTMTWDSAARINTLKLEAGASFAAATANLRCTLLEVGAGANVTVGDLTASNVYLSVQKGLVTVEGSLTLVTPFIVRKVDATTMPQAILRIKNGAGTITKEDFVFEGYENVKGMCRYRYSVEDENGYQVLYVEDLMPGTYDETSGYVRMRYSEGSAGNYEKQRAMANDTLDYTSKNGLLPAWMDGQNPHAETNYYCQNCIGSVSGTFAGRSLTCGDYMRVYSAHNIVVNDWRFLPGKMLPCDVNGKSNFTLGGQATLLTTRQQPGVLQGGVNTVTLAWALVGDSDASMVAYGTSFGTPFTVSLKGDMSKYYGEIAVSNNTKCVFRESAANATILLAGTNSMLAIDPAATGPVEFDTIKYADGVIKMDPTHPYKVKTLDFADGARLVFDGVRDLADYTGFEVTEACRQGGKVLLDFNGVFPSIDSGEFKLIKASAGVTIDPSAFVVTNLSARFGFDLQVKTLDDGSQVLYAPVVVFPKPPAAFDATTGYVVQTGGDSDSGNVPYRSFADGHNWSDGNVPHPETNYYTKLCLRVPSGKQVFGGGRLVSGAYVRCEGNSDITIDDFWVTPKPSGGYNGSSPNMILSVSSGGGFTVRGKTTVFTTMDMPFQFEQSKITGGVEWPAKAVVPPNSAFRVSASATTVPRVSDKDGSPYYVYLNVSGDTSECYGTAVVGYNADLRLGTNGLAHGAVCFQHESSGLVTTADGEGLVSVAELTAMNGGIVTVANANVLSLGLVTFGGTLTKLGSGTLAVRSSVAGEDALLAVNAGAVRPLGAEAFRNVSLVFGRNGCVFRAVADATVAETGLLTAKNVECGETLPVLVEPIEPAGERVEQNVVLMTVPSAQAETLAGKLRVRAKGYRAGTIVVSDDGATGLRTLSTTLLPKGFAIIVK